MKRRNFLALAAATPLLAAVPNRKIGRVEVAYKSPGPHPNGLQATAEGLWVMDQGNNRVYLIHYDDGKILRSSIPKPTRRAESLTMVKPCGWRPLTTG